jgi:hypothetical protein
MPKDKNKFFIISLLSSVAAILAIRFYIKVLGLFYRKANNSSGYPLYYQLRNKIQALLDGRYLHTTYPEISSLYFEKNALHIFCIMYNDYTFLTDIILSVSSNTKDDTMLWIIDNSNNTGVSEKIRKIALESGVKYYKLPDNPYSGRYPLGKLLAPVYERIIKKKYQGSNSHGLAINWVCHHIIQPSNIQHYGFIDHDIIPTNGVDILNKLNGKPFYGRKQDINGITYLWPGFCFFNRKYIDPKALNFLPAGGADSGSANAFKIFKQYPLTHFAGAGYQKEKILSGDDLQDHYIEYIDDWLHIINASNWKNSTQHQQKMVAINELRNKLLPYTSTIPAQK